MSAVPESEVPAPGVAPLVQCVPQWTIGKSITIKIDFKPAFGKGGRGFTEVDAKELLINGVIGHEFALHVCPQFDDLYKVTHVETGFCVGKGETKEAAIEQAVSNWKGCPPEKLSLILMRARNLTGVPRERKDRQSAPGALPAPVVQRPSQEEEILALHRKLAAETLRADQGWQRYESANADRNALRMQMVEQPSRNEVLEEVAALMESKQDGVWANTCGHGIRAMKNSGGANG